MMISPNPTSLIKVTFIFQMVAMEQLQPNTAASTWLFMDAGKAK